MLTAERISYIKEWEKSGNAPREYWGLDSPWLYHLVEPFYKEDSDFKPWVRLNILGLTIAALADALGQACETAEELTMSKEKGTISPGQFEAVMTMRRNRKELIGE